MHSSTPDYTTTQLWYYMGMQKDFQAYFNNYVKSEHAQKLLADLKETVGYCEECGKNKIDTLWWAWTHDYNGKCILGFEHLPENKGAVIGVCKVCSYRLRNLQPPKEDSIVRKVWDWFWGE